jgi:hypothetical protein
MGIKKGDNDHVLFPSVLKKVQITNHFEEDLRLLVNLIDH